jgi:MFS family permease
MMVSLRPATISVWYAAAMIATAIAAPVFGHAPDRIGMIAVTIAVALSALATPLAFTEISTNFDIAACGSAGPKRHPKDGGISHHFSI